MSFVAEASPPHHVLDAIRAPFEAWRARDGGDWVEPPVIQPLSLLLDLAGEAMRTRLFVVQGEGLEEACLRPDFTIPLARAHLETPSPLGRYYYHGKAFRTAPAGSGRPAEFWQIGMEAFGAADDPALQDAEVAALGWSAARAGGRDDLGLVLGDVALFTAFLSALDVPQAVRARLTRAFAGGRGVRRLLADTSAASGGGPHGDRLAELLADLPEAEAASVLEALWRLAGIQPTGGRSPAEIAHRLSRRGEAARAPRLSPANADLIGRYLDIVAPPAEALSRIEALAAEARVDFHGPLQPWVRRLRALEAAGVPDWAMILSTGFMRPFGYYDGMMFEVRSLALGFERPAATGGRYDSLPTRLGSTVPTGAVGCMVRPGRAWAESGA